MKQTKLIIMTALTAVLFFSCKPEPTPPVIYEAKMTSFGFYAADNVGIIVQDYVDSTFTGNTIQILMPKDINKAKLIARFTTTEGDQVKVGEIVQQSGVTVNDFSNPVDYIVSEGTANVRYTVTVGKAPDYVWTRMEAIATDSAVSMSMSVNPVNGMPYLVYKMKRPKAVDQGIATITLKEKTWTSLGQISDGEIGSYYDIAFNSKGVPFVAYLDKTTTPSLRASVKSYNGTGWNVVGELGASSNKVSYHSLSFVNDNKLLLMATYNENNGVMPRRNITVNMFENGSWTRDQTITGRADGASFHLPSTTLNGIVYLTVYDAVKPNTVSLYAYDSKNNAWTTLINKWHDAKGTEINIRDLAMDVDNKGNVYIALADNSAEATHKLRVIKYDAEKKEVAPLGAYISSISGNLFNFDLTVSPLGIPFVVFKNKKEFPAVVYLDSDKKDWSAEHVFENLKADDLSIDFASDGIGYAAYTNEKNKMVVYKFAAP